METTDAPSSVPERAAALAPAHAAALQRYAESICHNPDWARDAVQDTFLYLLRHPEAPPAGAERPWLFRVCRSRVIDRWRKEGRMISAQGLPTGLAPVADGPDPARAAELSETAARLLALVDTLPPIQREVVRLRFQADLSYREIADVTAKSVNHVGVLLHEALTTLRRRVSTENPLAREA